jgi:hypothetical protein
LSGGLTFEANNLVNFGMDAPPNFGVVCKVVYAQCMQLAKKLIFARAYGQGVSGISIF